MVRPCLGAGVLLLLLVLAACHGPKNYGRSEEILSEQAQRQSLTVLLRELGGSPLGSGVLVAALPQGRWVVSNRHVVSDRKVVCVSTYGRKAKPAFVVPIQKLYQHKNLDLALIMLSADDSSPLPVAEMIDSSFTSNGFPLIVSTGFPSSSGSSSVDVPNYTERPGLLVPLLRDKLQDGLDLAYTSSVEKGMSGGGVFVGSALIGVNSAHRDPLWPGQWRDMSGRPVDADLNQKLDQVSLGLSARQIRKVLRLAVPPSLSALADLMEVDCALPSQDSL